MALTVWQAVQQSIFVAFSGGALPIAPATIALGLIGKASYAAGHSRHVRELEQEVDSLFRQLSGLEAMYEQKCREHPESASPGDEFATRGKSIENDVKYVVATGATQLTRSHPENSVNSAPLCSTEDNKVCSNLMVDETESFIRDAVGWREALWVMDNDERLEACGSQNVR